MAPASIDEPARSTPVLSETDVLVVGGGFTGLWAAVQAKEEEPDRDVVLLESDTVAEGASGRNGGFADPSLTHGLSNGLREREKLRLLTRMAYGLRSRQTHRPVSPLPRRHHQSPL